MVEIKRRQERKRRRCITLVRSVWSSLWKDSRRRVASQGWEEEKEENRCMLLVGSSTDSQPVRPGLRSAVHVSCWREDRSLAIVAVESSNRCKTQRQLLAPRQLLAATRRNNRSQVRNTGVVVGEGAGKGQTHGWLTLGEMEWIPASTHSDRKRTLEFHFQMAGPQGPGDYHFPGLVRVEMELQKRDASRGPRTRPCPIRRRSLATCSSQVALAAHPRFVVSPSSSCCSHPTPSPLGPCGGLPINVLLPEPCLLALETAQAHRWPVSTARTHPERVLNLAQWSNSFAFSTHCGMVCTCSVGACLRW